MLMAIGLLVISIVEGTLLLSNIIKLVTVPELVFYETFM